jgi:hypothetical protein
VQCAAVPDPQVEGGDMTLWSRHGQTSAQRFTAKVP